MFTEVSPEKFYRSIGPLNVHPRIVQMDREQAVSDFELQDGTRTIIGRVVTLFSPCGKSQYYLAQDTGRN